MNLPNKLTILRIVLTFVFILFLFTNGLFGKIVAFLLFAFASITDVLDGFIAKKSNQITDFGKLMDPIADKILVLSAFIAFAVMGLIPAWMVIIIVLREVAVTALRAIALTKGKVIQADSAGKNKTVWQMFVIAMILLFLIFDKTARYGNIILMLMLITVFFTLISGISYLVKNKEVYCNAKTH